MNFHFFPAFEDIQSAEEHIKRVAWYICPDASSKIYFYVKKLTSYSFQNSPDYNDSLACLIEKRIATKQIMFVENASPAKTINESEDSQILIWESFISNRHVLTPEHSVNVLNVSLGQRMIDSLYINIFKNKYLEKYETQFDHELKFNRMSEKYNHLQDSILFCSGPSVSSYSNYNYKNKLKIICNSIIADADLMKFVKPDILVFADPIFHFGFSKYTEKFYQNLRSVLIDYPELDVIIPFKYWFILKSHYPDIAERTTAIPFDDVPLNLNLKSSFLLKSYDNILTFLMIPVATSLTDFIYILGADGKEKSHKDYFWSHNQKTQYPAEMEGIRKVHSSFFNLSYEDYYTRHVENLTFMIKEASLAGKSFYSVNQSHIEILSELHSHYLSIKDLSFDKGLNFKSKALISYNPNLKSLFGHYYHYDAKVFNNLSDEFSKIILVPRNVKLPSENNIHIHSILACGQVQITKEYKSQKRKLKNFICNIPDTTEVTLFSYTTNLLEAILLLDLSIIFKRVVFKINLFYIHRDLLVDSNKEIVSQLYSLLGKVSRSNIQFYLDSSELIRSKFQSSYIGFWPMIHVSSGMNIRTPRGKDGNINVLVPGTMQINKGILEVFSLATYIHKNNVPNIKILMRGKIIASRFELLVLKEIKKQLSSFNFIQLVEGDLTNAQFEKMFDLADVALIPYQKNAFRTRTSGSLVDSIFKRLPVVSHSASWLGGEINRLKVGKTYSEDSPFGMLKAIHSAYDGKYEFEKALEEYDTKNLASTIISKNSVEVSDDIIALLVVQKMPEYLRGFSVGRFRRMKNIVLKLHTERKLIRLFLKMRFKK